MSDLLGKGWALPVDIDSLGQIRFSRGEANIAQSIQIILLTRPGQRVMRPEFGCQIHQLAFAPNDAHTAGLAAQYVREALARWEPRIIVHRVLAEAIPDAPQQLLVTISYEVRATSARHSFVFPFARTTGE